MSLALGDQALYDASRIGCALSLDWGAFVVWDRAEIIDRLDFLRRTDPGFTRFGSAGHRYLLNQPLTESAVTAFEVRCGVSLPKDYRTFLLEVGDGGAGPFYGVFRLDRSDHSAGNYDRPWSADA